MDELRQRVADLSPAKRGILELQLERNRAHAGAPAIPRRSERHSAPASFAQERLWLLDQLEPNQSLYNIARVVHLSGSLAVDALELALQEIITRHETLRTSFAWVGESLRQVIDEHHAVNLPLIDLGDLTTDERSETADRLIKQESERPFNLSTGPIIRTTLFRLGADEHILSLVTHHIANDAWSAAVLFNELEQLYGAFAIGKPSPLKPLSIQYPDFAEWQREWLRGPALDLQLSYWKDKLASAPLVLDVPADRPRPVVQTFRGSHRSLRLSRDLSDQLISLSRREGATLFMTLLAAFQVLLSRYSRQSDIVVGSPISGRNNPEIEELIGFFVNTLVLRSDLSASPTFRELLAQVRNTALEAYEHQDLPFEKLVEELQPERDLGRNPVIQVMFQLQNAPRTTRALTGLTVRTIQVERHSSKFDLFLMATEHEGALSLSMEYSTDLFHGSTIDRMLSHYENLLKAIVEDPDVRVLQAPLLTDLEKRQLIYEWNDTAAEFAKDQSLHRMFEAQARRDPLRVALIYEDERLTYGELNGRANQLAQYLRTLGVGPETLVGLCVERSLEMVIGLLAILKAGGAFVPLDPAFPRERLAFMIDDADLQVLLTQKSLVNELPSHHAKVVVLDAASELIRQNSQENLVDESFAANLAYVIYTSGSTGTPKGVLGLHRAMVNRFQWMWQTYPFAAGEVCCQKTSLSFVDSIWEIFGPLLQGVPNVILPDDVVKDPSRFIESLSANDVSRIVLIPSLLKVILDEGQEIDQRLSNLKYWVCSGESLPVDLAESFCRTVPHGLLINLYGSSEVAADVSYHEARPQENQTSIPIGHPIANTQIYLLDANLEPVPVGTPGELYVGGEGLARGYLNRPDLTAEKFIPNIFSDGTHTRLYRTGDLARHLSDGTIEYLGRIDSQVKIRGFRIELGEIESVLREHASVRESVVVAREDTIGDKRLVAYVVGERPEIDREELLEYLRRKLPEFMVPAVIVELKRLPLTPSGKINRRVLPAPDYEAQSRQSYIAPRTPLEETLAGIWVELLKVSRVGINDHFFDIGGHSLLAMRLISRVRELLKIELPLRLVFESPTISGLSAEIMRRQLEPDRRAAMSIKKSDTSSRELLARIDQLSDDEVEFLLKEMLTENSHK